MTVGVEIIALLIKQNTKEVQRKEPLRNISFLRAKVSLNWGIIRFNSVLLVMMPFSL